MFINLGDISRRWLARLRKPAAWAVLAVLMLSQAMAKEGELPMKVEFRQTGGYAGPAGDRACELDTRSMPASDAQILRSLVERSNISDLASKERPAPPKGAADYLTYTIRVETEKGVQKFTFDDMNVPQSVIPLLEYLSDRCP